MKTSIRSVVILVLILTGASTSTRSIGITAVLGPVISDIGGYSDGVGVSNGRWTGQPSNAPPSASNSYNRYLAIDTWQWPSPSYSPVSYWDIYGSGFGNVQGDVSINYGYLCPCQYTVYSITSWSNTKIRVKVGGLPNWTFARNVKVVVRTASGAATSRLENLVAAPKGRGFGQCTWEVFNQRKSAGSGFPPPSVAYPTTAVLIGAGYVPRQWDVLFRNTSHTGIITSVPVVTIYRDGKREYSFTLTERNAKWDEARSDILAKFSARNGTVVQSLIMKTGSAATHYWR